MIEVPGVPPSLLSIAIAALGGGALTKVIDKLAESYELRVKLRQDHSKDTLTDDQVRRSQITEEEAKFRQDLRQQIADLKVEVRETRESMQDLAAEVGQWREKYYSSIATNLELNAKYTTLSKEHTELKADYAELTKEYHDLKHQFEQMSLELKALKKE